MALLLPKLRSHFAEFLNNASPVGLRILSSPTCVGLRYGCHANDSGFSWQPAHPLPYLFSVPVTSSDCSPDLPGVLLPRLDRALHSRLGLSFCVPTVLLHDSTGISTCYPSTTSFDLALGPDLPRADHAVYLYGSANSSTFLVSKKYWGFTNISTLFVFFTAFMVNL